MYPTAVCLALAVMCLCACAQKDYSTYVPSPVPLPHPQVDSLRAESLIDATRKLSARRQEFLDKVLMAKAQALELLAELQEAQQVIVNIGATNKQERQRLAAIFDRITRALNVLTSLENSLAGALAGEANIAFLSNRLAGSLNDSVSLNRQQKVDLAAFVVIFRQVQQKLLETLESYKYKAAGNITLLASSIESFVEYVNTKRCISYSVDVKQNGKDTAVVEIPITAGVFPPGDVPQVFCGIQDIDSTSSIEKSVNVPAYGYAGFYSERPARRSLGLSVVCKAFEDKIRVTVIDTSESPENKINAVQVLARACSLPAAGFAPTQQGGYRS